jgi:hypothetical protein
MLQALSKHKRTNYHFLFTCDESWMFYPDGYRTGGVAAWDDIHEIERPPPFHQKIMFTIFFNGTGECKIAILPERQKGNRTYFIGCVRRPLTKIYYPQGRGTYERIVMLHFDTASVHNTKGVQEGFANFGFRRTEHSPYSPRLAPCHFSLFSAMK